MIEILDQAAEPCLTVRLSGKVSGREYKQFIAAVEEHMEKAGSHNLVLELDDFEFYEDFEAAKQDLKFGLEGYKHFRRAALVGDQKWITWFTRLIGPFTRVEEKHFPKGQLDEAVRWAIAEESVG